MSNITVTNNTLADPIFSSSVTRDDVLAMAGAATVKPGTILARDSASGKLVLFVKGGSTNGNGVPKAIITYEVVVAGAGDTPISAAVSGEYRKQKLVIATDGDASNIDAVVMDQLRDYGMTPIDVSELNILDNQ